MGVSDSSKQQTTTQFNLPAVRVRALQILLHLRPSPAPSCSASMATSGGVATCCEDIDYQNSPEHEPMLGYQTLEEGGASREESTLHCHQSRREGVDERARRKLLVAAGLCLLFMIAEIVGGVLSNSLAIATDAAHMLTDFASFLISLFAIWMAAKPKSQKMSFGWHRAEVLGAIVSVLMIWVVTGILVYTAALRIITGEHEVEAEAMLITSGLGVLV